MQKNLNEVHAEFLKNLSIAQLNPMQEAVIERASSVNNLMLVSPTGTGKTLAFLIAVYNTLRTEDKGVQAIIVAPSRELALQIEQVFKSMKTNYKSSCCYGGHAMKLEQDSLRDAPAVLIATPGRLADHIDRESFDPTTVKTIVLDEFDKSLQMGFHEQLKMLFKSISGKQQHILTSATPMDVLPDFLPFKKIETLNYTTKEVDTKLQLKLVRTKSADKVETLMRLVAEFNQEVCVVFCNHREAVERISALFRNHKFEHGILHGAMEQIDREKNLIKFRGGAHNVLIATDLAARGLDIPEIKHVVHYQLPLKEDAFIHRNGRTARMHAHGEAYLLLADDESLPVYLDQSIEEVTVNKTLTLPPPPAYACIYISAGKKDKINKGDIAGMLMKKAALQTDDVGLITTLDHSSYVSVKRSLADKILASIKDERLKKMKVKIEIAN
ncbi:DEAD/DEAH box helicase [Ohtaekwangia koreensis]|uniref:Superfamily II DNA and RNA helicase n=1 Tax=Ohtaekwangia koreensis TaxID=688867 RepID=A0A1T5KNR2_9BACT|nr:DEAD/DEAH box helicase [Ohtaekwangia koreensis]SKC65402.1 Superfamily II DNA and RNA helicase [Ohtaekwangia koreensis]